MTLQLPLSLGHRSAFGERDFLVSPSNKDAVAWLDLWPNWPNQTMVIYGPADCGKTHLARVWQARNGAHLISPGNLTENFFPSQLDGIEACIIDDVEKLADESALLHLHNILGEREGHLLLTSRTPPARWQLKLADLRSRMKAATAVKVGLPDDTLIRAILIKLFADRQLHIGSEVINFLITRIERSFTFANRLVRLMDEAALAGQRRITVPLAREVIMSLEKERG